MTDDDDDEGDWKWITWRDHKTWLLTFLTLSETVKETPNRPLWRLLVPVVQHTYIGACHEKTTDFTLHRQIQFTHTSV